eukprot:scaffold5463_cov244-Ochromonas_danica.AAC.2
MPQGPYNARSRVQQPGDIAIISNSIGRLLGQDHVVMMSSFLSMIYISGCSMFAISCIEDCLIGSSHTELDEKASRFTIACEPTTHDTVARQIKNWVRSEKAIWQELSYYSTILTSVDERRVVHLTGWKPRSLATANGAFEDLRRRASS